MKINLQRVSALLSTCLTVNILSNSEISKAVNIDVSSSHKPHNQSIKINRIAQKQTVDCGFAYVDPANTRKTIQLKQFGINIDIPSNYRAMLHNDGKVEILDPGSFKMLQCIASNSNTTGQGYPSDSFKLVPNSQNLSPKQIVAKRVKQLNSEYGTPSITTHNWNNVEVTILEVTNAPVDYAIAWYKLPNVDGVVEIDAGGVDYSTNREVIVQLLETIRAIKSPAALGKQSKLTPVDKDNRNILDDIGNKFEIRLRLFIPSPAVAIAGNGIINKTTCRISLQALCVFNGDGRTFSYNEGTHKSIQNVVIDTKSESLLVGLPFDNPFRDFCPTYSYLPSQSFQVQGQPRWWWDFILGAVPRKTKKLQVTDNNSRVSVSRVDKNTVKADFYVRGKNPLIGLAPPFDAFLSVYIRQNVNGFPEYHINGSHDGFPAYEIYINGERVYDYNPVARGGSPAGSLGGRKEIIINQPYKPILQSYLEQPLEVCRK